MHRRVLVAIMTTTTIVIVLFSVPLALIVGRLERSRAAADLEHRAALVARHLDLGSSDDQPDATDLPAGEDRLAVYTAAGALLFGTGPQRLEPELARLARSAAGTVPIGDALVTSAPIVSGEEVLGIVRAERPNAAIGRAMARAVGAVAAAALVVLIIGWIIARRIARSVARSAGLLADTAGRLGGGDFTVTAPVTGIAELDAVGSSLAVTARYLEERIARERDFSADTSHQLRTPLAGLRAAVEAELAYPRDDSSLILREAMVDIDRLDTTVTDLLTLARAERRAISVVDVGSTIEAARGRWLPRFEQASRRLTIEAGRGVTAGGNAGLLRQALDVLIENTLQHGGGTTSIATSLDDGAVTIVVTDEGRQVVEQADARAPGLGLPLVRRLVEAQGGRFVIARAAPTPQFHIVLRLPSDVVLAPGERDGGTGDIANSSRRERRSTHRRRPSP